MTLCSCGCGNPSPIAKSTERRTGAVRGQPQRYIRGHNMRGLIGEAHPNWRGGAISVDVNGYVRRRLPGQTDNRDRTRPEHALIVERVLGHALPARARVHHVDGDKRNNANTNLVACENTAYHNLLHQRQRALEACGHADWRKCVHCKQYDAPQNLYIYHYNGGSKVHHRSCDAAAKRNR